MDQDEELSIPLVDEFALDYLDELQEDIILERRMRTWRRGDVDYLRVGLKGTHPSKAKWIQKDKVRELLPKLSFDWWNLFVVQKALSGKAWYKKDIEKSKDNSKFTEATQEAHNGLNR